MECNILNAVLGAFIILACSISLLASGSALTKKQAKHALPSMASVLGVKVGDSTIEALERKLGRGAPCMGGHPHGGRAWHLSEQRVWVYADGFGYSKTGRILDFVRLGTDKSNMNYCFDHENPQPVIPEVKTGRETIGWLCQILPGMAKQQVVKLARGLPKPRVAGNKLMWSKPETYTSYGHSERSALTVELSFKKDILTAIDVYVP